MIKNDVRGHLLLVTICCFLACSLLTAGLVSSGVLNISDLGELTATAGGRQRLRFVLLLSNLIPFAGTALLALAVVYRRHWAWGAGLDRGPEPYMLMYSTAFFVVSLPFVSWLAYLNLQVPLPEWAVASEENTDLLLGGILNMTSVAEFLLAFVTAAVVPAIGEELLLRGVVQRRIIREFVGNAHLAIWITAVLFSTMHVEFAGFAPRLLLGVILGYAYYWSRSLWVPIGLHLAFNGMQVIVAYVTGEFDPNAELTDTPAWWMGVLSLGLMGLVWWKAQVLSQSQE